ncbi:AAA family ATPase [Candidatus Woesearchaeota archaeon]|nr:AAA family ATPase [Candidatus Woesearchaeota archaeon]
MIIGLTGTMGSGKGEVVKYLKTKGFEHYVYSDILRDIAKQRGIEATRENLQKLGTKIKKESKNKGILSKKLLEKVRSDNVVVDGIRSKEEILELKKSKEAYIIAVTAPQRLRFRRLIKRNREGDPKTFSEFKRLDNRENRGKDSGQEINNCLKMADFRITNNSSLEILKNKIEDIIRPIS